MRLRDQILASPETLSDLAWAAEQRFRDAEELLFTTHPTGAVYLLGLAAEMWLKLACARCLRLLSSAPVFGLLGPARSWMAAYAPSIPPEGYHSLAFWTEYLIRRRRAEGIPLSSDLAGGLRHHIIERLFRDWKIDIRYRFATVSFTDAWRVYNDVVWVRETRELLGR